MSYYFVAEDSPMNSFSPDFLKQIQMLEQVKEKISIPTLPLAAVFERHLPKGQAIDFLNVDVEGHDLEVLESNDWKTFRPRVIVVEDEVLDPRESAIVRTMKTHGYELCAQNVIILDKINEYFLIDRTTG
jgi:hypothetical protein